MIYCTPKKKQTPASVQGVGVDIRTYGFSSPYHCEKCSKEHCAIPLCFR